MVASPRHAYAYWRPRLALASAAGFLALGVIWVLDLRGQERAVTQQEETDAGTVALGDSVPTAPVASAHAPSAGTPIAQELPAEPFPGQLRTDARGRCPAPGLVPLKGGCWIKISKDPKECAESEYSFPYQGACYMPAIRIRGRPATSKPSRDGG